MTTRYVTGDRFDNTHEARAARAFPHSGGYRRWFVLLSVLLDGIPGFPEK